VTTRPRPSHRSVKLARLGAVVIGLVAALALIMPSAAPAATTRHVSGGQLSAASAAVERSGVEGVAWYVDEAANQVVVTADGSVSADDVATIKRQAGTAASAIRIERATGAFRPLLSAGDAIYGTRYRCSLGFNVVSGSTYYFLTAGHCGKSEKTWYTGPNRSALIGPTVGYSFPDNDYSLVRYDNTTLTHPGGFTVADAVVGETVTRDHGRPQRQSDRAQRHGALPGRRHGQGHDPDHRLRRAGRLGWPALRRVKGARAHLRRQR